MNYDAGVATLVCDVRMTYYTVGPNNSNHNVTPLILL